MGDLPFNTIISVGGIAFAAVGAWFAVKYGQRDNEKSIRALRDRIDGLASQMAKFWSIKDDLFKEQIEDHTEIKFLRRDVDELRKDKK